MEKRGAGGDEIAKEGSATSCGWRLGDSKHADKRSGNRV